MCASSWKNPDYHSANLPKPLALMKELSACGLHRHAFLMYNWNTVVAWAYSDENITHSHYKKDVSKLEMIDVYRVLDLWQVNDHAIGHAIKKLLNAGQRGSKDMQQDIQEAIDSLTRWQEMQKEDEA